MESLPTMDDLDSEPIIEELNKAITEMASWKALGNDGIPAELPFLHDILVKYWREDKVLQDIRDAMIITNIHGAMSDCHNRRKIFLLSIAGNDFSRVIVPLLQKLAERIYNPIPSVGLDLNAPLLT